MTEAIKAIETMSPIAAIVIIAGVAAMIITQLVKQKYMTKARAQLVSVAVSVVIGFIAYVVSGVAGVFPDSFVSVVSTAVVIIAAVALTSRAAYSILGRAIPDGREDLSEGDTPSQELER